MLNVQIHFAMVVDEVAELPCSIGWGSMPSRISAIYGVLGVGNREDNRFRPCSDGDVDV